MSIEPHKAMPLALAQAAKLRTAICLLESGFEENIDLDDLSISASTLETLHARVQELEDHIAQARKMVSAPVLPEPFALYDGEKWYANEEAAICSCATMQQLNIQKLQKVFTEQQVRALLATGAQAHVWEAPVRELLSHIDDILPDDALDKIDTKTWGAVSRLVGIAANCLPQADALDAECFRFWVSEAARSPAAMAKLIMHCTTEGEYRAAITQCIDARKAAIAAAQKGE